MVDSAVIKDFEYIAALVGYYLAYSIRSGSKTQDVFKSLLGIGGIAAVPAAAASFNVLQTYVPALLVTWGRGAICGFIAYFIIAAILAAIYSATFTKISSHTATGPAVCRNSRQGFAR